MNRKRLTEIAIWVLTALAAAMMFAMPVRDLVARLRPPVGGGPP